MTEPAPMTPTPDDKDWTWVLARPCPDCGFDPQAVPVEKIGPRALAAVAALRGALTRDDARTRPSPEVWSPLEYACHVRDVCLLFQTRLALTLDQDDPVFLNWDQDETALIERYWEQDPVAVSAELDAAARDMVAAIERVTPEQRSRRARRSNGSVFTAESLCQYFLHDLVHHVHDVEGGSS